MAKQKKKTDNQNNSNTGFRTPIITVMGHVDHGKTTLLDAIRGENVVDTEEGGITQNTRAHQIETEKGNKITFIDTPGHEAFSAMRARGAEVTDFVLLVVAADDGIQDQTKESIEFAQETNTQIIVAINKMDIPGANPDKVKRELGSFGVNVEEYGGDTQVFEISALKEEGLDELVEGIELQAEISELEHTEVRDNTLGAAYVLESSIEQSVGPVALCVMINGGVSGRAVGVAGDESFKVRAFLDQNQDTIKNVSESDPVWITGLDETLDTGATIYLTESNKQARRLLSELQAERAEEREVEEQPTAAADKSGNELLLELMTQRAAEEEGFEQKKLNIVVRASTKGTLEAVEHELNKLGDEEREIEILNSEVGTVSESDVQFAKTTDSIIVSFQANIDKKVLNRAKQDKIIVRNYEVIYEMMEELTGALDSLIEPEQMEVEIARAKIKQIFELSDGSLVAGCEVVKGTIVKGYSVYVERPSESTKDEIAEVGRGKITDLREGKNEVREVKKGLECGISIQPEVPEMQKGDEVVAFKLETMA